MFSKIIESLSLTHYAEIWCHLNRVGSFSKSTIIGRILKPHTNSRQLKNENLRILVIIEVHLKTNFVLIHPYLEQEFANAPNGDFMLSLWEEISRCVRHQFAPIQLRYLRLYSQRKPGHRADKIQLCTSHTLAEGRGFEKRGKVIALRGSTNLGECDTQRAPVRIKLIRACGSYACVYNLVLSDWGSGAHTKTQFPQFKFKN